MKNVALDLLEHLEKHSFENYVNIFDYFKNKYPDTYKEMSKDAKVLLDELILDQRFIRVADMDNYTKLGNADEGMDFDAHKEKYGKISAKITTAGLLFLSDLRRNKAIVTCTYILAGAAILTILITVFFNSHDVFCTPHQCR